MVFRGRYDKYTVVRTATGLTLPGDSYFVLVPGKDPAARIALAAYAEAADNGRLAADLRGWLEDLREDRGVVAAVTEAVRSERRQQRERVRTEQGAGGGAEILLSEILADGERPARQVWDLADQAGLRRSQIRRAAHRLGVAIEQVRDPDTGKVTGWQWRLP